MKQIFSQYMGQRRTVYVLFFGRMVTNMGALIWPMMAMILSRKLGYSQGEVGMLLVLIGFIFLPATWIGGKLADRFNKKKLIIAMDIISVFFFISCAFITPSNIMVAFFVIAGWFAHMESPIFESLVMDVTTPDERETAFSMLYLGSNLGIIVGTALAGLLFENYFSLSFIIDGLTTITSTIFIIAFVHNVNHVDLQDDKRNIYEDEIDAKEKTLSVLLDRRSVMVQMFVFFLTGFVYDQYVFALPLYMVNIFAENGATYFGLLSSFNGIAVIVMTPFITRWTSRYTELPKVMLGIGLFSISYLLILGSPALYIFFAFMWIFTIGEVLNMLGTSPFVSRRIPSTHRGRVNSWVYIAYFLGTMVGKGTLGFIIERMNYTVAFSTLATVGFCAVVVNYFGYRMDQKRFPLLHKKLDPAVEKQ